MELLLAVARSLQQRRQPKPPAIFRVTLGRTKLRYSGAPAVSDLDPDQSVPGLDRDRDRLSRIARAAVVHAIAGQPPVYQQDGDFPARVHWAKHPSANARAIRARAARPAFVTLSRTAALAISAPALPRPPDCGITGPPDGHTGMHARLTGARQAGTCRRRGPSVAVRETADGAHRP